MATALFTPAEIADLPALRTAPPSYFDLDDPSFLLEVDIGIVLVCFRGMGRS
jgi:hypothetical protein